MRSDNVSLSSNLNSTLSAISTIFAGVLISGAVNINTSCSGVSTLGISCQSELVSSSTIVGNIINLVGSNLNVVSGINLSQTFTFPLTFPLVFNNDIIKLMSISGNIGATSTITDLAIDDLITSNVQSSSVITGILSNQGALQLGLMYIHYNNK